MKNKEIKRFDLLIIDEQSKSTIKTEKNLAHSLLSNASIAKDGDYNKEKHELSIDSIRMKISVIKTDISDSLISKMFLLNVTGQYQDVEPNRELLVSHITAQLFEKIYILCDEISEEIACKLYPQIYKVENALRGYLINFMSTRIGPRWWEATATGEWRKKVSERKNNETVFSKFVDSSAYLIDFSDLGKMVYEQSSGFNSKEDVVRKLAECEETLEAIRKLKEELKSNYQKFFKKHFSDNGFQSKWEQLLFFRNKVAHNNLFVEKDLTTVNDLTSCLLEIIKNASNEIPQLKIEESERDAIKESIVEKSFTFDSVSEDKFLNELNQAEKYFNGPGKYVGLSYFIREHLGPMGIRLCSVVRHGRKVEYNRKDMHIQNERS